MSNPSKRDRKRLRREIENSIQQEDCFSHVVSPLATDDHVPPDVILATALRFGVNLVCQSEGGLYVFGIPAGPPDLFVALGYGSLDEELLLTVENYQWLAEARAQLQTGSPVISLRAKVYVDPAIDFLNLTIVRALGRLTKGVLINGRSETVEKDWLCWSQDYLARDMWSHELGYNDQRWSPATISDRFPRLRSRPETASTPAPEPAQTPPRRKRWWSLLWP